MLSILIPVYNQTVVLLTEELNNQARMTGKAYEILVMDDGSEPSYRKSNAILKQMEGVGYFENQKNTGRSSIRNLLAARARYPYLLFLDGDSVVRKIDFVEQYLQNASPEMVVCGGRIYPGQPARESQRLHHLYGTRKESGTAAERSVHPDHSFMSNNFLIPADVFRKIKFEERLNGYGHEDTLFGFRLSQAGVAVKHIENPVVHGELKSSREFLDDSLEAVANLLEAWKITDRSPEFAGGVKLLDSCLRLKRAGLGPLTGHLLKWILPMLRQNLLGKRPLLFFLNLVKLEACLRLMSTGRKG